MTKQEFFDSMIDFTQLKNKSDEEIADWARDKWSVLMENEWWGDPKSQQYVMVFARYMKHYAPDLFIAQSEKSD